MLLIWIKLKIKSQKEGRVYQSSNGIALYYNLWNPNETRTKVYSKSIKCQQDQTKVIVVKKAKKAIRVTKVLRALKV